MIPLIVIISLLVASLLYCCWITFRIKRSLESFARKVSVISKSLEIDSDQLAELSIPASPNLASVVRELLLELGKRTNELSNRQMQQNVALSSMRDGVVMIDSLGKISWINKSAAQILDTNEETARGKDIEEVVRSAQLQRFISIVLCSDEFIEQEVYIYGEREIVVNAYGKCLKSESGQTIGGLVVLSDVTEIRKLENMRKEFVANVSHELKTPITSIKGFVETLVDGAIEHREDSLRFLGIISRQADRLNDIFENLLSLSRIERENLAKEIEFEPVSLYNTLFSVIQMCAINASKKQIRLELNCSDSMTAMINAPLIEQAIMNLIDNAIKYSNDGGTVKLNAYLDDIGSVVIEVSDSGCGISKEHLPRIFERFYRADKARSRELGGTGLGLSIVKHIVQAHQGTISVESELGHGSKFTMKLPSAANSG